MTCLSLARTASMDLTRMVETSLEAVVFGASRFAAAFVPVPLPSRYGFLNSSPQAKTMARQNTLPAYRIYTLNEDKNCLGAHNYAPMIARHLAAILNEPVYIYSLNSLLYKGVVRP